MSTGSDRREDLSNREINVIEFSEVSDSFEELGLEGFDEDIETFREEALRAGKSRPVLYVDDEHYESIDEDVGALHTGDLEGSVPVKILPKKRDLFAHVSRFSFGQGIEELLEEDVSLLVHPAGEDSFNGDTRLAAGEEAAAAAYRHAVEQPSPHQYLDRFRGVQTMNLDDRLEIQVDEASLGTAFDYTVSDEALVVEIGDETVEVPYDDGVVDASFDRYEEAFDPRVDEDAQMYKFVVE